MTQNHKVSEKEGGRGGGKEERERRDITSEFVK